MLTVKASAKPSKVHGIGLFADERIPKGTITWKFNQRFDLVFEPKEVAEMPKDHQDLIDTYAYLSAESGKYVYSIDDSRFTNHSSTRNNLNSIVIPGEVESVGVANRDIEIGEEMLINYREFDVHDKNSDDEYLDE